MQLLRFVQRIISRGLNEFLHKKINNDDLARFPKKDKILDRAIGGYQYYIDHYTLHAEEIVLYAIKKS